MPHATHPFKKGEIWHKLDDSVATTGTWAADADHYKDINTDLGSLLAKNGGKLKDFDAIYLIGIGDASIEEKGVVDMLLAYDTQLEYDTTPFTNTEFGLRTNVVPMVLAEVVSASQTTEVTKTNDVLYEAQAFRFLYMRTSAALGGNGGTVTYSIYVREAQGQTVDLAPDNRTS